MTPGMQERACKPTESLRCLVTGLLREHRRASCLRVSVALAGSGSVFFSVPDASATSLMLDHIARKPACPVFSPSLRRRASSLSFFFITHKNFLTLASLSTFNTQSTHTNHVQHRQHRRRNHRFDQPDRQLRCQRGSEILEYL